jgi:hypothetical protein
MYSSVEWRAVMQRGGSASGNPIEQSSFESVMFFGVQLKEADRSTFKISVNSDIIHEYDPPLI